MMMEQLPIYATGRLETAVECLVGGEHDVRDRLLHAALTLVVIPEQNVPIEGREEHVSIMTALTSRPAEIPGEGTLNATIRKMDVAEAQELALRVFRLHSKLLRQLGPREE